MRHRTVTVFLLFAAGIALGIPVTFVGNILAGELILIALACVGTLCHAGDLDFADPRLIRFFCFFFLSLVVYAITDLFAGTPLFNALRGWARFVFLLGDFTGLWVIGFRRRRNLFVLLLGYMIGQVVTMAAPQPSLQSYVTLWKHHLCMPVVLGLLCLSAVVFPRSGHRIAAAILAWTGAFSLAFDTRAFGIVCLVTAAIVLAQSLASARLRALSPFVLGAGLICAGTIVFWLLAATEDRYGRRQAWSNEERYASMLTAAQTIARHPFAGEGSWKTDFEAASRHHANLVEAGGLNDPESWNQSGHSQILQTWLEGGPLAAFAFLYLFWRLLLTAVRSLHRPVDDFLPLAVFISLNAIWSCLFSPFLGPDIRVNTAAAIYVCIVLGREKAAVASQRSLAIAYPRPSFA